ncbi:unnamed protein product [Lymnaea stagnalis]|uniref:Uncharacterized protein n=1 Tax=Lymnaea stagnalis TaxID=6523 RepID=A0AAV2I4G7_LYMST
MGKLLDKFIPTFLQNFVPSDAAFAGFGSNNSNNNINSNRINNNNNNIIPLQPTAAGTNANGIFGGTLATHTNTNPITNTNRPSTNPNSLNQFINVRNDHEGCTIAVPNIVPQC